MKTKSVKPNLLLKLKAIVTFQRRIFPLVALFSVCAGLLLGDGTFSKPAAAITCIASAPYLHYFIYELRKSQEYYFYYNLGLSCSTLWISSLTGATLLLILILLL